MALNEFLGPEGRIYFRGVKKTFYGTSSITFSKGQADLSTILEVRFLSSALMSLQVIFLKFARKLR